MENLSVAAGFVALTVLLLTVCNFIEKADDFKEKRLLDRLYLFKTAIGIFGAIGTFTAATYPSLEWGGLIIALALVVGLIGAFVLLARYYRRNPAPLTSAPSTTDTGQGVKAWLLATKLVKE